MPSSKRCNFRAPLDPLPPELATPPLVIIFENDKIAAPLALNTYEHEQLMVVVRAAAVVGAMPRDSLVKNIIERRLQQRKAEKIRANNSAQLEAEIER